MSHSNRSKNKPKAGREPRPAELAAARKAVGLSQAAAAEVIYTSPRSWEKWEQPAAERGMPASAYELFLIKTGQYRKAGMGVWQLANGAVIKVGEPDET